MEIKVYMKDVSPIDSDMIDRKILKRIELHGEENDYRTIESNTTIISIFKDGSILFYDDMNGERSVYFYPDELNFVWNMLQNAIDQRDNNKT